MSFERPWLLLSLLVLALAVGLWIARRPTARALHDPVHEPRRPRERRRRRSWTRFVAPALFGLALTSLLVALARPQVDRTLTDERATVILVIDTSRSMQATDVKPTRLGAAQDAVRTFISRAPSRLRIGLIVFAGEAQVATPPTRDHDLVRQSVDNIGSYRSSAEPPSATRSGPRWSSGSRRSPSHPRRVRRLRLRPRRTSAS